MAKAKLKETGGVTTLVTFLLDRTGSMSSIKPQTIESYNQYLHTLKKEGKGIEFNLVQFDSESIDKVHVRKPIADVPLLTDSDFLPRANTPLVDAAYITIKAVEQALEARSDKPKVVVCIQTDGQENASHRYTWEQLRGLIDAKQGEGWQFNFLGAGIDAYQQAAAMHIPRGSTVSYATDMASNKAAFHATASNIAGFSSGARGSTMYTPQQKTSSGDAYDPDANGPQVPTMAVPPQPVRLDLTDTKPGPNPDDLDLTG